MSRKLYLISTFIHIDTMIVPTRSYSVGLPTLEILKRLRASTYNSDLHTGPVMATFIM